MKSVIQFKITQDGDQYTAEGIEIPVVTQAKTLDELAINIREATNLALEGENLASYDLEPSPSIMISFELPMANA
ncbi:MAG: type II toxin-antitoxin system HicB family antitoxin [bacterium]